MTASPAALSQPHTKASGSQIAAAGLRSLPDGSRQQARQDGPAAIRAGGVFLVDGETAGVAQRVKPGGGALFVR
jgi:hypothetical protein